MIFNKISKISGTLLPAKLAEALRHCATLGADSPVGRTELDGDRLVLTISEYNTISDADARPENHRHHIDVQLALSGGERIMWYPADELVPDGEYSPERDIQFYRTPASSNLELKLVPGMVTVLFPQDAHMTMLNLGSESAYMKKAVYKIKLESI